MSTSAAACQPFHTLSICFPQLHVPFYQWYYRCRATENRKKDRCGVILLSGVVCLRLSNLYCYTYGLSENSCVPVIDAYHSLNILTVSGFGYLQWMMGILLAERAIVVLNSLYFRRLSKRLGLHLAADSTLYPTCYYVYREGGHNAQKIRLDPRYRD